MGIIKALKLGFDYQRYDDDGNVVDMQRAVNDVNLDIEAGEFVAVLGHNGSGKSTLAKHMNALLIPTEGTMLVMAMRPRCIILDEPTAMLDPNGRKEVLEAVRELNRKEKVTVILITHYMEEVIHADRVYVMDSGNVVMQGNPKEIFSQVDTLKKYGLDVPQVTLLAYELKKSGVDVPDGILTTEELVSALCQSN